MSVSQYPSVENGCPIMTYLSLSQHLSYITPRLISNVYQRTQPAYRPLISPPAGIGKWFRNGYMFLVVLEIHPNQIKRQSDLTTVQKYDKDVVAIANTIEESTPWSSASVSRDNIYSLIAKIVFGVLLYIEDAKPLCMQKRKRVAPPAPCPASTTTGPYGYTYSYGNDGDDTIPQEGSKFARKLSPTKELVKMNSEGHHNPSRHQHRTIWGRHVLRTRSSTTNCNVSANTAV